MIKKRTSKNEYISIYTYTKCTYTNTQCMQSEYYRQMFCLLEGSRSSQVSQLLYFVFFTFLDQLQLYAFFICISQAIFLFGYTLLFKLQWFYHLQIHIFTFVACQCCAFFIYCTFISKDQFFFLSLFQMKKLHNAYTHSTQHYQMLI